MDIKVIVATHKQYTMPNEKIYLPVLVGSYNKTESFNFLKDDTGDNISNKNASYCELTGLYRAWKNLKNCDALGLVHYRRYFKGKFKFNVNGKNKKILNYEDVAKLMKNYDMILPKKRYYVIDTNRGQYIHAHHSIGLEKTKKVIETHYNDYVESFNKIMNKRSGHRFNMMILKKQFFDGYCTWLFDILGKVEDGLDISSWSKSEQRIYGYIAERLLDVWVDKNKIKFKEVPYVSIENSHIVKKGWNFILRKIKNK